MNKIPFIILLICFALNSSGLFAGTEVNPSAGNKSVLHLKAPPPLTATVVWVQYPIGCEDTCSGIATVTVSGGTPPYTYAWAPLGITNDTAFGLCNNTFTLTVTDATMASTVAGSGTYSPPAHPATVVTRSANPACPGFCDGFIAITVGRIYDWVGNPEGDGTYYISSLCAGSYTCYVTNTVDECIDTVVGTITNASETCDDLPCYDCIPSFSPIPGKKYLLSAWVKEESAAATKTSYTYPGIRIIHASITDTSSIYTAAGGIIDGWQRIEQEFTVPLTATDIEIELRCSTGHCFFDDIRVLPFDGSLKSYVYDPVSLKLVAELDERNYATLYEYDEEGKLVRVKKETEKGIMTIKESRSVTKK